MEAEIERLKEENHKLTLKIDSVMQTKNVEVEYLREEVSFKDSEIKALNEKHRTELKSREKELLERVNSITEEAHQSREEITELKEQNEKLSKTIEHLKATQLDRSSRLENYEASRINNEQLTQDLKSKSVLLDKQQTKVNELTRINDELRKTNVFLKEDLETTKSCICDLQTRMKDMEREHQEDIIGLQQQICQQTAAEPNDPNKRGNSLFSEIEERRLRVEEELNRLRTRNAKLTTENAELQASIENGDCRSSIITTQLQLIHKSDVELIQEMKKLRTENYHLFDTYRERMESLRNEYRKKLLQYRDGNAGRDLDELEGIRSERDRLISDNMSLERDLFDLKRDLKHAKQQQVHLEANYKIMRTKLQAAQDQLAKLGNKQNVNFSPDRRQSKETNGEKFNKSVLEETNMNIDVNQKPTTSSMAVSDAVTTTVNQKLKAVGKVHKEEIQECKQQ